MNSPVIAVLYFTNSVVRGGAEEHILTLLRKLDRAVFRPVLVCPSECAEQLRPDLPQDVPVEELKFERPYQIGRARQLAKLFKQYQIGIVHSHLFSSSLAASPVARLSGVPVVMETPHLREAWRHGLIKGSYAVDRAIASCVDHYIAVSEANARYLINEKRLPLQKVHVIHNGCDLNKYNPHGKVPPGLRASLGVAEDDPVIVALGRLEPQKGHRNLLDAQARVLREIPKAKLVCVGTGALAQELLDQTRKLGIQNSVRFVGYQSNVADWLALADISVLPSLFEGLPLVAIESLAAQRPMVATAVDGTVEVIINDQTGLTVPPDNVEELAAALIRLLRQPELRSRLAQTGRQFVLEHFSQEQQIRKTQDLYLSAWEVSPATKRIRMTEGNRKRASPQGDLGTAVDQSAGASRSR
jgi:glycosyltransferase involved in cell wall biosynthesis